MEKPTREDTKMLPENTDVEIISEEEYETFENQFNRYERMVLGLSLLVLAMICVIAAWSGILLQAGMIEGGGPLGMFMDIVPANLLLKL